MRPLFTAVAPVFTLLIAACGQAPPPVVVAIAPADPPDAAVEASAVAVAPARLHTLAAAGSATCVLRGGRLFCFGDTPAMEGHVEYGDAMHVAKAIDGVDDAASLALSGGLGCVVRRGGGVACFGVVDDGTRGSKTAHGGYVPRRVDKLEPIEGLFATQIAVGESFGCGVRAAGDVVCWGTNRDGELGDASKTGRLIPVGVAGIDDAVEVAAGTHHACARRKSGAVWCWGSPSGNPNEDPKLSAPRAIEAFAGATHIAASQTQTCAIVADGAVVCANAPAYASASTDKLGVVDVAVGGDMICGVTASGGAACSGAAESGQLGRAGDRIDHAIDSPVDGVTDAVDLAAGDAHACALGKTGTLRCWGKNDRGQLGVANAVHVAAPTKVPGVTDATRVAITGANACAVTKGGEVFCWGDGTSGVLGDGGSGQDALGIAIDASPPVAVAALSDATDLAAGDAHVCAVRKSGKVSCWGDDRWGQLGDATSNGEQRASPFEVPGIADAVDLDADGIATCVARKSGKVTCWGTPPDVHVAALAQAWTGPGQGTLVGLRDVARVGANDDRGCAVRRDGSAACWGFEVDGLRDAKDPKRAFVELRGARGVAHIAVGDDGLVLFRSGELRELDFSTTFRPPRDARAASAPLPLGAKIADDVRSVARCVTGGCFVRKSGDVACYADGKISTFGITDAIDVAAGSGTYCAVRKSGEVACWGDNENGQCGVDPELYSLLPVEVTALAAP